MSEIMNLSKYLALPVGTLFSLDGQTYKKGVGMISKNVTNPLMGEMYVQNEGMAKRIVLLGTPAPAPVAAETPAQKAQASIDKAIAETVAATKVDPLTYLNNEGEKFKTQAPLAQSDAAWDPTKGGAKVVVGEPKVDEIEQGIQPLQQKKPAAPVEVPKAVEPVTTTPAPAPAETTTTEESDG